jgi:uncharacterized caspase-like protein
MIRGTVKPSIRSTVRLVLVNSQPADYNASTGAFSASVALNIGDNPIPIALVTSDNRIVPTVLRLQYFGNQPQFVKSGKQYALLIANQAYTQSAWPKLKTPVADVRALANVLRTGFGFETTAVVPGATDPVPLVLENVGRNEILKYINYLNEVLTDEDSLLVFYAGHGYLDELDKAYWIPIDGGKDDYWNWISSADLEAALQRSRAKHVLLVADSCYSGKLMRGLDPAASLTPDRGPALDLVAHLTRVDSRPSRIVVSSGAAEPVADGGGGGHSVFAGALLKGLAEEPSATFTTGDLFAEYLRPIVSRATDQIPQISEFAGNSGGDLVFVRKP